MPSLSTANDYDLQAIVELLLPSKYRVPEPCIIANNTREKVMVDLVFLTFLF
jgi:hypothetical protein